MRSARRRALIEKKRKTAKFSGLFFKLFLPTIFVLIVFAVFKFNTKYWNGSDKFVFTNKLESGDVAVNILDPKLNELTALVIPKDTQIDVARNYGELPIKNVWQLGLNEKIGGRLLAETVTHSFLFPVFLWSSSDAYSLVSGKGFGIIRFIFFPKSTNIPFGDRFAAGLFALQVDTAGRNVVDLGKNQFLSKQKLNDGQIGYVLNGEISPRLTVYFSDNSFAEKSLRVAVGDATGYPGVAEKIGQVIEILGGKVVSMNKKDPMNIDCQVTGKDSNIVKKIANIFSCKIGKNSTDFDLEIELGQAFAKRF
jgi:hypothetical protein